MVNTLNNIGRFDDFRSIILTYVVFTCERFAIADRLSSAIHREPKISSPELKIRDRRISGYLIYREIYISLTVRVA